MSSMYDIARDTTSKVEHAIEHTGVWSHPYRWLSARLQYLQCVSNGDTAVLHYAIDMILHVSPSRVIYDVFIISTLDIIDHVIT